MDEAQVFVSHAGRDRAWAEWVAWQLERAGLSVELDYWDWRPGENFITRMDNALRSCRVMVALFSEAYFEPPRWTTEEWTAALVLAKSDPAKFAPVRIEDVAAPAILAPILAPALFGMPAERAREELLRAVRGPTRPSVEPPFPDLDPLRSSSPTGEGGPRLPGVLPDVWGGVPLRNVAFSGRDSMLVSLREGLSAGGRSVVQALHGMGGVGKTQLAAEYAWRFANEYDAVWWVTAEQADLIGEQLSRLATELRLVEHGTATGPSVQQLFGYLRRQGRWLVVFDNAMSEAAVRPWLPAGPGHVVITSRNPHWAEVAARIKVDVFAREESVALLRGQVLTLKAEEADRLADALGDLPLAVAQAAGLIGETGMPAEEYLQLLQRSASEVLAEGLPSSYPSPLAAAVQVSFNRLAGENQAAGQLLTLCASFGPEPIPAAWFSEAPQQLLPEPLATIAARRLKFRRMLRRIGRYGLASVADDRLQLHRLTQAVLRDTCPADQRETTAGMVQAMLAAATPGNPDDPMDWPGWAGLLPHLRSVDLGGTSRVDLRELACNAVWYLLRRGETWAGIELAQQLRSSWIARYGPYDYHSLWVANSLGQGFRDLGQYGRARTIDEELLKWSRRIYGEDSGSALASAVNLAIDLEKLGEVQLSRELCEDTFARRRRIYGKDHPDTLAAAHQLGVALHAAGRMNAAREVAEDTRARSKRVNGEDHPRTLAVGATVASILQAMGEVQAARDLNGDVLARMRRVLGDDHPDTLTIAHNLAACLHELRDLQAARDLGDDTLARMRRVLGEDHPATFATGDNLALMQRALEEEAQGGLGDDEDRSGGRGATSGVAEDEADSAD